MDIKTDSLLKDAQEKLKNLKNIICSPNMDSKLLDTYLTLSKEAMKKKEQENKVGKAALQHLKDAFSENIFVDKMQTLKDIEELIYVMINKPEHKEGEDEINLSVDQDASFQSLTDKIRVMIRHDRGFSLVNSSNSGGIPSPIRESESFKKLIEFKESSDHSDLNSGKVKKIEFSDTMTRDNGQKKNKKVEKVKGDAHFTHSSIDRMVFQETDEFDHNINAGIRNTGDSISETVKIGTNKNNNPSTNESPPKEPNEQIEQSFENPGELVHEMKKYSLRSSVDEKFYDCINDTEIKEQDINIPSLNTSLMDYPNTKVNYQRNIIENNDINQESTSHKGNSSLKMKKNQEKVNEK